MVASKDDCLVSLTTARVGGAMACGDSSTPAKSNRTVENVSARLRSLMPRGDTAGLFDFKLLPKHLMLQLDNLPKENKNQMMIAFGSDLVLIGVFETVLFFFLMVGHTHEDIDATFSKATSQTQNKSIEAFPQLMAEYWKCMVDIHMVPWLITN
jgi:hypothetical protein